MSEKQLMQGWKSKEFSEVVLLQRGYDLPVSARCVGTIAVLGSNGQVGSHNVCPKGIPVPTLTVGRSGSVGKVCFSDTGAWPLNTTLFAKDYCGNVPKYIYYWLQHVDLARYAQGVSVPTLNRNSFSSVQVSVPPFNEQLSIASVLERCEKAINIERSAEKKANELKHATMHKLFTCGLRGEPQKETEIGLVPKSWEVSPLENISSLERGRFLHRPRNEPRFYGGSMPFIQTGDVVHSGGAIKEYSQTLNDDGIQISRVFPAGTILITIAANIGYTGILQMEAACPDSLIAITPNESVIVEYLHYYLQTQQPKMDQAAPKGTQKNINIQFLSPWPVPVPPTEQEQQEIVDILDAIDQKINLHRRKKAVLEELFKSLLHKLMTGEVRVDDLDLSALEDMQPQAQGGAA